jgi:hypothetical protein
MITPHDPVSPYAMVFRTGAVEFVSPLIEPDAAWIEDIIFGAWRQFFDFAKKFNVEPPILVFATLIEVAGVKFSVPRSVSFRTLAIRQSIIRLPEVFIGSDVFGEPGPTLFKRVLDVTGNAFGLPNWSSYDAGGKYRKPR